MNWFVETILDHKKPELRPVLFTAGVDQELIDKAVENEKAMLDKFNARWVDGRIYVAGHSKTTADYNLLTLWTSVWANTHGRNPSFNRTVKAHCESLEHVMRILENIKTECHSQVEALGHSHI